MVDSKSTHTKIILFFLTFVTNTHITGSLQGCGSGFGQKKPDPGLCISNKDRFLKFHGMNILDPI